jgi:hypothetical protein
VPTQRYALEPMPTTRSRVFYHWLPWISACMT